jgi:hypothetical protein
LRVDVSNAGRLAQRVSAFAIAGDSAGEFEISADRCAGVLLASGSTCVVRVRYAPRSAGSHTAVLAPAAGGFAVELGGEGVL